MLEVGWLCGCDRLGCWEGDQSLCKNTGRLGESYGEGAFGTERDLLAEDRSVRGHADGIEDDGHSDVGGGRGNEPRVDGSVRVGVLRSWNGVAASSAIAAS